MYSFYFLRTSYNGHKVKQINFANNTAKNNRNFLNQSESLLLHRYTMFSQKISYFHMLLSMSNDKDKAVTTTIAYVVSMHTRKNISLIV